MADSRAFAVMQVGALVGFAALAEAPLPALNAADRPAFLVLWLAIGAALLVWAAVWPARSWIRVLSWAALACLMAAIWTVAYRIHLHAPALVYNRPVAMTGRVIRPPETTNRLQEFTIATNDFGSSARLLIQAPLEPVVALGSQVSLRGTISLPAAAPGQFDYTHYLEGQQIIGVVYLPTALAVTHGPSGLLGRIGQLRLRILRAFYETLPEPAASLAAGLSIGIPPQIDAQLADALRRVSLTHLAAVSGQNVTLAVFFIFFFLRRRWLRGAIAAGLVLLVGYVLLVGNDPSIVRAGVMASLVFLAPLVGRPLFTPNALLVAANGIALFNPLVVTRDVGFQLSFMVLGGLLIIEPFLAARLRRLPWGSGQFVSPVLVAAAMSAPVQLATFGTISLVGPLANLLALPLAPVAMGGSMLLAIVANLSARLGQLFAWLIIVPLEGLHYLALSLAGWRFSQLTVTIPPGWQAVVIVAEALLLIVIGLCIPPRQRRQAANA